MKIVHLGVKGFRSLFDVSWMPGDLNVVIGPNGSGKSNLLKTLEMLTVSTQGGLSKQVLREGGMGALVWDGRVDDISFDLRLGPSQDVDRGWLGEWVDYDLTLSRIGSSSSYQIVREELAYLPSVESENATRLAERTQNEAHYFQNDIKVIADIERFRDETLLSAFSSPLSQSSVMIVCREQIASWRVYHQFSTDREALVRQAPVARYEKAVNADGSNLIQVLHTLYTENREFEHDLNLAMRAAFGDDFDKIVFPPASDQRIQMRVRWKSLQREQSAADLSDGMLRFLHLIAILANPEPPALIAIDEPETGLHPSMLPIIAEYAAQAALRTQVIFTTHSAEFLSAFDRPPVTTVTHWDDGKTVLQTISGETLRYWLKEYTLGKLYLSGELEGMA